MLLIWQDYAVNTGHFEGLEVVYAAAFALNVTDDDGLSFG
jgi:hypothetical protein